MNFSPEDYLAAAIIAREAGIELLSRLELMTIVPDVIIDAGCATGEEARGLCVLYPQAKIVSLDQSTTMLHACKAAELLLLNADATLLPLKNESVDIFFANLLLPWLTNLEHSFKEWRRIMKDEGLILFSTLGLDTLKAYQPLFAGLMPSMTDMHDIGDLLMQCGFSDPVVDVSYITLSYQDPNKFIAELVKTGMLQHAIDPTLLGEAPYLAEFEIIFGHAFAPAESDAAQVSSDGIAYFPLNKLRRSFKS